MNPETIYVNTHLWIPKSAIRNSTSVKASLEFAHGRTKIAAWSDAGTHWKLPRGYLTEEELLNLGRDMIWLNSVDSLAYPVGVKSELRPGRQQEAFGIMQNRSGVVCLACGAGKTVIALHAWASLQTPGLVIVHTLDLLEQWRERALEHLDLRADEIGEIRGKTLDWKKPLVLASIQTLVSRVDSLPPEFQNFFGVAIYDEVHHLAAPLFNKAAALTSGLRWGLSATPEREDGNDPLYKYHIGPVIYKNLDQDLAPECIFLYSGVKPGPASMARIKQSGQVDWNLLCEWLSTNETRNALIRTTIQEQLQAGRKVLVLSRRVEHVEHLHGEFRDVAGMIHNGVHFKDRGAQLRKFDLVIATADLAREGLDRKDLDTIIIVLPVKRRGWIQQILGRIQRGMEGKSMPRLIVIEDEQIPTSRRACTELRGHLTDFGYEFTVQR